MDQDVVVSADGSDSACYSPEEEFRPVVLAVGGSIGSCEERVVGRLCLMPLIAVLG